jgi:hypothetical protein
LTAVVAEGFFIHRRHVHTIHAGASVDVVIDVDIILLLLIVVVATKLRCNGFVLNINNSTSVSRESRKVGEFGKSELTLDGCGEDVPNNCLWRLVAAMTGGGSFRPVVAATGGSFRPAVAATGGSVWVVVTAACGAGSSAASFFVRLGGGRTIGARGLEVAPPVRLAP